jgi:hypothetical protein
LKKLNQIKSELVEKRSVLHLSAKKSVKIVMKQNAINLRARPLSGGSEARSIFSPFIELVSPGSADIGSSGLPPRTLSVALPDPVEAGTVARQLTRRNKRPGDRVAPGQGRQQSMTSEKHRSLSTYPKVICGQASFDVRSHPPQGWLAS